MHVFQPITKQRCAKPEQILITLKTALKTLKTVYYIKGCEHTREMRKINTGNLQNIVEWNVGSHMIVFRDKVDILLTANTSMEPKY